MHSIKHVISSKSIVLFILIVFSSESAHARSVYVITDWASTVKAYDIQGDRIVEQATAENLQSHGDGAVGLALDPYSETLFVTYEGSNIIEMVNAKTMVSEENPVTVPGVISLAGIAFDHKKQKLYIVERYTDKLFVYLFDPASKALTLEGGAYKTLYYLGGLGAFGIAIDESSKRLYVSNTTSTVHYYDTNSWNHIDSVDVNRGAVGIAVDPNRHYLYTGSWSGTSGDHTFLVRTDISDINDPTNDEYNVGDYVIGLTTDVQTGLVYITDKSNEIKIFDTSIFPSDPCEYADPNFYQPRDIIVRGDVSYKAPFPLLTLVKDDNDIVCASPLISEAEYEFMGSPYNWLYYNIEYNANGHADTNVYITDHLPIEVDYNSSDPCGLYDPIKRTVTWNIPVMSASDSNTYRIQVAVNYHAKPGHKIFNLCEIESDEYYAFVIEDTNICCYGGDIIYVDADANDPNSYRNGNSWFYAYNDLQDALHTARNCPCDQIWVAKQIYKPTDIDVSYNDTSARSISFELVNNVAIYGGFPPGGGAWTQRNPDAYETILSGDIGTSDYKYDNSYHVVKCVDVNNAVLDGFTITAGNAGGSDANKYGGGIYCKDSNNFALTDCNVSGNSAYCGGGMCNYNEISSANITNCVFTANTAYLSGGGMYNYLSSPKLINCTFTLNTATNQDSFGGGMYNESSSPTIINCTFSDNSMGLHGQGGAIYNTGSDSKPNMTNCTFTNNSAYSGGAFYNVNSEPNITNCVFSGNTADSSGGGMYNNQSSPRLINCIFSGNSTDVFGFGGAIYNTSLYPKITNCTFTNNSANRGGAVYNNDSEPNITNCIFAGNYTNNYGGGVYSISSKLNINNCIFIGNDANNYGGGIANYSNYQLVLTNCTLSGNWAHYGGGIYNINSNINITNCILWSNEAISYDEIYYYPSYPTINYSDIKGGWSGGFGNIDKDPCFFEVEQTGTWTENASYDNSTFQSTLTDGDANWAVNELAGKFVNPNTSQALQFFIVSNDVDTIKVWSDVTAIAGEGDTYYIYDYHLRFESPCIDTGDPNGDYSGQTDIDGESRVFDGDYNEVPIVDMGADEYYWSPADFNTDGFVNFFDYAIFAGAWLTTPTNQYYNDICDLIDNDYIDSNDLARFCEDWLWQTAWAKAFPSAYDEGLGRSMSMGMGEGFFPSIQAKQAQPELTAEDIEEILKWLEDLWLTNDEVRKMITEDEWLKFIESVKQAAKEQIYN